MSSKSSIDRITIQNKKIIDFYNKYPGFNPEIHLLFIVEAIENTINSSKDRVDTNMLTSIYQSLVNSENERKVFNGMLNTLNDNLNNLKETVNKIPNDILALTTLKITETKDNYIHELKELINKNDSNIPSVLNQVIQDNTKSLIDKTSSLLHEIIPNNEKFIESQFKLFQQTVQLDLIKSLNDMKSGSIDNKLNDFATQLDIKLTNLVYKCVNTSEERLSDKITHINDVNNKIYTTQDKLINSITDITDKFKNSSHKGSYAENILFNIVSSMYPTADVVDTTRDGSKCGDLLLKRQDKDGIVFENKAYTCNVPQDEVNKFQRDIHLHEYNGIFLSQSSGISGKPNFFIEINSKNNILLYVHKVGYSQDLIKLAVDVIDTISEFIHKKEILEDERISIDYSLMESINREVSSFIIKKKDIIDLVKEQQKTLLHKLEDMHISTTLVSLLNQHFGAVSHRSEFTCSICNKFNGKSAASLSAHRRRCKLSETEDNIESPSSKVVNDPLSPSLNNTKESSISTDNTIESDIQSIPQVTDTTSIKSSSTEKKRKTKVTKS